MKKNIIILFFVVISQSLLAMNNECVYESDLRYENRARCYPLRVYALRRFETEGEINYSDISWAGKREDSFYDSLTNSPYVRVRNY